MSKDDLKFRTQQRTSYSDWDKNIDRLAYWSGLWSGGPHDQFEEVWHEGAVWVCRKDVRGTTEEPKISATDWQLKTPSTGRGAMTIDAPKLTLGTIGAGWEPVEQFDSIDITAVGIVLDPVLGTFQFQWPGIWDFRFSLVFEHDESNQSRMTNVREWNVTQGIGGTPLPVFISRNQPGTTINYVFPLVVTESLLGDLFRFEIGGGDTITVVQVHAQAIDAFQQGPNL